MGIGVRFSLWRASDTPELYGSLLLKPSHLREKERWSSRTRALPTNTLEGGGYFLFFESSAHFRFYERV